MVAQVLGYAGDKKVVVNDLLEAMRDPSDEVRNNAMRTLLVFADTAPSGSRSIPRVPPERFIDLLSSPFWSDRNKASGALLAAFNGTQSPTACDTADKGARASRECHRCRDSNSKSVNMIEPHW